MNANLIGLGSAEGLGGCGCSGSRSAGMAGFGAGPDGLGAISGAGYASLAIGVAIVGAVGYFAGGYAGKKINSKSNLLTGAVAGAATGISLAVLSALRSKSGA